MGNQEPTVPGFSTRCKCRPPLRDGTHCFKCGHEVHDEKVVAFDATTRIAAGALDLLQAA